MILEYSQNDRSIIMVRLGRHDIYYRLLGNSPITGSIEEPGKAIRIMMWKHSLDTEKPQARVDEREMIDITIPKRYVADDIIRMGNKPLEILKKSGLRDERLIIFQIEPKNNRI
jgi:hypothetical protein